MDKIQIPSNIKLIDSGEFPTTENLPKGNLAFGKITETDMYHLFGNSDDNIVDYMMQGEQGEQGESAYQSWLNTGNNGDESDFIRWVKASSGGQANVGEIFWWPLSNPPGDSLYCNGDEISRIEYSKLFEVIGTMFGTGNGSTTFNLPDMRYKKADLYPCIRYKVEAFPYVKGYFGDSSLAANVHNIPTPIITNGDSSLIVNKNFIVSEDGVWALSFSGTTTNQSTPFSGTLNSYITVDWTLPSQRCITQLQSSQSTMILHALGIDTLLANDIMNVTLLPSVSMTSWQHPIYGAEPSFWFGRIV